MTTYNLGNRITTRTPERPELSNNGGDYYFYTTPILQDNVKIGTIFSTSAEFDYCMATGTFTKTMCLYCPELNVYLNVAKKHHENNVITVEEFLYW